MLKDLDKRRSSIPRHISNQQLQKTTITDISNANVEIILGLRRLGGQIFKSDLGSRPEMLERAVIKNAEEKRKMGGTLPRSMKMNLERRKPSLPVPIREIDTTGVNRKSSLTVG